MEAPQTISSPQEALDQLERSQARWSNLDALLRRLVTRLTYAADGRLPTLDATLATIRMQVREPLEEERLEPLLSALAEAIKGLDDVPAAEPQARVAADGAADAAPHPFTETLTTAQALLAVVDQLRLDGDAIASLEALRETINTHTDAATLAIQAEALAGVVNRHCRRLGEAKTAAEQLLRHVTDQLEELAAYLDREDIAHQHGETARQQLDSQVIGEITALGDEVRQAQELGVLQEQVQSRLGAITDHLREFRQREETREREWQARTEQMSQRIRDMERAAQAMEATLRHEQTLASTDPLTGVANRLVFEQHIAQACLQVARTGAPSSLLVLDIDRFKQINDSFGHAAGDRALRIVAEQLRAGLRSDDLLARYGGEEFVVVLTGVGAEPALKVAESLRRRIENLGFHGQQRPVRITLSCGVTVLRQGDSPDVAFERADSALYRAKRGGRNRCELA